MSFIYVDVKNGLFYTPKNSNSVSVSNGFITDIGYKNPPIFNYKNEILFYSCNPCHLNNGTFASQKYGNIINAILDNIGSTVDRVIVNDLKTPAVDNASQQTQPIGYIQGPPTVEFSMTPSQQQHLYDAPVSPVSDQVNTNTSALYWPTIQKTYIAFTKGRYFSITICHDNLFLIKEYTTNFYKINMRSSIFSNDDRIDQLDLETIFNLTPLQIAQILANDELNIYAHFVDNLFNNTSNYIDIV